MFPLVEPTLEKIADQLYNGTDIKDVEISNDSKYTENYLVNAIKSTLAKAEPSSNVQ
jgi:hypothetical protein